MEATSTDDSRDSHVIIWARCQVGWIHYILHERMIISYISHISYIYIYICIIYIYIMIY